MTMMLMSYSRLAGKRVAAASSRLLHRRTRTMAASTMLRRTTSSSISLATTTTATRSTSNKSFLSPLASSSSLFPYNLEFKQRSTSNKPVLSPLASSSSSFPCNLDSNRRYLSTEDTAADAAANDLQTSSFVDKRSLEERLSNIERTAATTLLGFYEPHLQSFSVQPGRVKSLSVTSTCFALQAILAGNDNAYDALLPLEELPGSSCDIVSKTKAPSILNALLYSNWRHDDLFQASLLLSTALKIHPELLWESYNNNNNNGEDSPIQKMVQTVLQARPHRQDRTQPMSDYILFQITKAYAALQDAMTLQQQEHAVVNKNNEDKQQETLQQQLTLCLSRCAEISMNELCRQLAYRAAHDKSSFDVMRTAYSLLTYLIATETLHNSSHYKVNIKLVRAALKAFFEEQQNNGMWDKGQPIYTSLPKKHSDQAVGNAFVYSVDTLGTLLQCLPAEEFRPYLPQLERTLVWMEHHQTVDVLTTDDYDTDDNSDGLSQDAMEATTMGHSLRGWVSPHLRPDTAPQAWSTAQTLHCVSQLRRQIRALMHKDVLQEFHGISYSQEGKEDKHWDRLLDSDVQVAGGNGQNTHRTLKRILEKRVLQPFASSVSNPSLGAAYSAILFGPPGTAKTTVCESLAQKMGWDFVVIDTSVFLADGLANVAARIRYVFERLQVLDKCVILFDEIEEFCLDREAPGIGMESRMLTTAMLTAINDLRRAKRSIFFLATNRLRAFDSAITRPGRFDMQIFVGPPNLESRITLFKQKLASVPVTDDVKTRAIESYRQFLESVWEEDAMFMNYLESVQFASACANAVASAHGEVGLGDVMRETLESQAAVMTVRGTAREEFISSMGLSRL